MAYTGVYERTIFYNPVNKYSVISVKTSDRSIPEKARSAYRHRDNMIHFAAVGYELPRTDQVSMILDGEWKEGKNGVQLHVTQCEEDVYPPQRIFPTLDFWLTYRKNRLSRKNQFLRWKHLV